MALEEVRRLLEDAARRRATVTYGLLGEPATVAAALRDISTAEDKAGRGMLSAVVVRADTHLPGTGFFRLAKELGRDVSDRRALWEKEIETVYKVWATYE